ncbi:Hypothetical predicted protein [Mytilus galloprovincialis]|uniref:AAA+ ATPase domain-containing protein n=1 Tax=Mytilus galloprovincialis TaxID=29158 RepID=A0A8B6EGH8_MYTGA|nr:Hypothetical predicted protein [Mytilus galloprovincialis]
MEGLKKQHATLEFESPTSIFMVGPSGSGKTVLTKHLLEQADGMFQTPPSSIFFCYSIWQPLYSEMQQSASSVLFHKGLPTMDQINEWGSEQGHKLLVFDDLMIEAADSMALVHILCVGSHHHNITILHLLQNTFLKSKSMRTASLSVHYFILMKTKRDLLQINTLGRKIFPGKLKYFMDASNKSTSKPFGYLVLDLSLKSDEQYQLRTNILPGQNPIVYLPEK